jgi:hypothetical protein
MDIMDPYTFELLSVPRLPDSFSGCAAANQTEFDDDYLWAIGALTNNGEGEVYQGLGRRRVIPDSCLILIIDEDYNITIMTMVV